MQYNPKRTFVLGLGFFVISLTWPLYNTYVPVFLAKYISSMTVIGAIMTLDNIAAITLQPYFGAKSDTTRTKYGRRMPYLLIGIPLSAAFFVLIPLHQLGNDWTLAFLGREVSLGFLALLAVITLFNLAMSIYRAPTVALMPDVTPRAYRSKANGIINFMGGLGAVLALIGGAYLYRLSPPLPFAFASVLMVVVLFVLKRTIKEPEQTDIQAAEDRPAIVPALLSVFKTENRQVLMILLAILFWFIGYQGVEATFSNYCVRYIGIEEYKASLLLGGFSLAFLAAAIPAGWVGTRFGKRRTIMVGVIGLALLFLLLNFLTQVVLMAVLLALGGMFWALININSYPLVTDMTTDDNIGTYTGLYYFFSSVAAISGPVIFGYVIDLVGFEWTFMTGFVSLLLALVCVWRLREVPLEN